VTAEVITVLAFVAGIIWLGLMVVAAFRNRGGEEIAPNLQPGIDDQQLETRRLEKGQKYAIAFSAFLAVSLPLYFLGEQARQEGFVEEFDEAAVTRGEHIVEEFACFSCHGPLGAGGSAPYVEKRSGVTVSWAAPSLNDVFLRYDQDEVTFWVTYGRGNTPMPAWGLAGGGPMNEHQVADVVNYLRTIQRDQQEVVNEMPGRLQSELARLEGAEAAVAAAIVAQDQVVREIDQAPDDSAFIGAIAERAADLMDAVAEGIDTDDDGLSDVVEVELSAMSAQALAHFRAIDPSQLDPAVPDAEVAESIVSALESALVDDPVLVRYLDAIEGIIENGEGDDADGDGIPDAAETQINGQATEAASITVPTGLTAVTLDPSNPASVGGEPDLATATALVGTLESIAISKRVLDENEDRIRPVQEAGLAFLREAQRNRSWVIEIPGVAAAMGASDEEAARAVGLFQANCARCHTSGFSAGIPFTQEAGSGGFGPALWDGRPLIQFGEAPEDDTQTDLLVDFLVGGSEAQQPYGLNGFGSGRMPAFGALLSGEDIELLARYLRSANMDGVE
jgi:mono/diheme cytochrome c family protein